MAGMSMARSVRSARGQSSCGERFERTYSVASPYHDYYIWPDGTPDAPPNGMKATFGGPAWTWVPELGQYYFHQFAPQQPDLNWENPAVRRALYDMINFWIAEGVAGFRLDVIDQIAKEPDNGITANGPRLMEFLRELNRETFGGKIKWKGLPPGDHRRQALSAA